MDKQMLDLVGAIEKAAKEQDFGELRNGWNRLYEHAKETGAPIDDKTSFRLLELMHEVGALDKLASRHEEDSDALIDKLIAAAREMPKGGTAQGVEQAAHALEQYCRASGYQLGEDDCKRLLEAFKEQRMWPALMRFAGQMLSLGDDYPVVRRIYAQALIESGQLHAAIPLLENLVTSLDPTKHERELGEAIGLLGRARKQIYIDNRGKGRAAAPLQDALRRSIGSYSSLYRQTQPGENTWHGINLIAMLKRAEIDRIEAPFVGKSAELARNLIAAVEPNASASGDGDPWTAATLAEAQLAAGNYEAAAKWFGVYANHKKVTAFHLASTVRQLREVWGVKPGEDAAGRILLALNLRLARMEGGRVELHGKEFAAERVAAEAMKGRSYDPIFEAVLGRDLAMPLKWYAKGLERANSVARLVSRNGYPVGTGFIVRGGDIAASLGDEPMLLTNFHVINTQGAVRALTQKTAQIEFEPEYGSGRGTARTFSCKSIRWESPPGQLDAALIELHPRPESIAPCPISEQEPKPRETRVFVIGHPGGRERSISLTDNELLGCGSRPKGAPYRYLHYRTPTEGGSSGSPVFEFKDWSVIGLHHAGPNPESGTFQRLDGEEGEHKANEGISILSIRETASRELGGKRR